MVHQVAFRNPFLGLPVLLKGFDLKRQNSFYRSYLVLSKNTDVFVKGDISYSTSVSHTMYLYIVALLVRDHGHTGDASQPALVQQGLLRLNTQT